VQEAINEQRAALLVEFILYRQAALRDFNEGVDLM
jgi:hypothetical protein